MKPEYVTIGDKETLALRMRWGGAKFVPDGDFSLLFTVKADKDDADVDAKVQKALGAGIMVTDDVAAVTLLPVDTGGDPVGPPVIAALTAGTYHADLKAQHNSDPEDVRTVWSGQLVLAPRIGQSTTSSVPIHTTNPPIFPAVAIPTVLKYAQDYVFTGAVDGDWSNVANWAVAVGPLNGGPTVLAVSLPGEGDNVILQADVTSLSNDVRIGSLYADNAALDFSTYTLEVVRQAVFINTSSIGLNATVKSICYFIGPIASNAGTVVGRAFFMGGCQNTGSVTELGVFASLSDQQGFCGIVKTFGSYLDCALTAHVHAGEEVSEVNPIDAGDTGVSFTPDYDDGRFQKVLATDSFSLNPPVNGFEGATIRLWVQGNQNNDVTMTLSGIAIPSDSGFDGSKIILADKIYVMLLQHNGTSWMLISLVGGY